MELREFFLSCITPRSKSSKRDIGAGWEEVIGGRELVEACFAEFDLAEEAIGFLTFADGSYEVGIGECMRPYIQRYAGTDPEEASLAFARAIERSLAC